MYITSSAIAKFVTSLKVVMVVRAKEQNFLKVKSNGEEECLMLNLTWQNVEKTGNIYTPFRCQRESLPSAAVFRELRARRYGNIIDIDLQCSAMMKAPQASSYGQQLGQNNIYSIIGEGCSCSCISNPVPRILVMRLRAAIVADISKKPNPNPNRDFAFPHTVTARRDGIRHIFFILNSM
jgi:hypothetical protein